MKKQVYSHEKEGIMAILYLQTKRQRKAFLSFRSQLYHGDGNYVATEEFVVRDILFEETQFAKSCTVLPVAFTEEGKITAQAILLYNNRLPYVQLGFFDALPNCEYAVSALMGEAVKLQEKVGAKGIVIGLNGHISYGVGILTEGFFHKNSFDSIYNKDYYADYFKNCRAESLSTYKTKLSDAISGMQLQDAEGITVRPCSLRRFEDEMEKMRLLCEQTIAKTNLYFPTEYSHFYELTKDLKPFLTPNNLLFAEDEKGNALGFLFYHPDFNQMLVGGRDYSLFGIAATFLTGKKKINTVKINAIGSLSPRATSALLQAFAKQVKDNYMYLETTFIWDNNIPSSLLAKHYLGAPHRKYEVYYYNESHHS